MKRHWLLRLWYSFSAGGLLVGTLFFAASLTPSLIPRTYLTQGVLSGCSLAAGYGIGVFWRWLWDYMELPKPQGRFCGSSSSRPRSFAHSWRWPFCGRRRNGRIRSGN